MVRLTDRPDMTLDVYRGRKTTMQQQQCVVYTKLSVVGKRRKKIEGAEEEMKQIGKSCQQCNWVII